MSKNESKKLKKGFFKKIWYSVFKLDKYSEMSVEGVRRAFGYLLKLCLLITVIIGTIMVFKVRELKHKGIQFIETQMGNFYYKDGKLSLENPEPIRVPSETFGEIIIDTNVESEEDINKYINSIEDNKGVILLKDKVLLKGITSNGVTSYSYPNLFSDLEIEETNQQNAIEIANSRKMWTVYAIVFAIVAVYTFINISLSFIFNAFLLTIFGYIVTWFARIKMRFAAIYNLSIYSLTLSVILNAVYMIVNMFTNITITYFQIMYIAIAAIYLIAAILMIKADFIKTQVEVAGIVKMSKENEELEEDEKEKEKEPENDEKKDKEKNDKKEKEDKDDNDEPEGSQA